jgi:hypothetical protein
MVAPDTPAQFSLPHSPVAKARVMVLAPFATRSSVRDFALPDTFVDTTLVFQSMSIPVSL